MKGRTIWYESFEKMQADLDLYLALYNTKRPPRGRKMNGKTPLDVRVIRTHLAVDLRTDRP